LWELPNTRMDLKISDDIQLFNYIKNSLNFAIRIQNKICTIKHSYSHFNIRLSLYHCSINEIKINNMKDICWIRPKDINNYAFSKSNHKLFKILNTNGWIN